MLEHLRAYVEAEAALREVGVLRSRNLVGDVAEWIACDELGLTQATASQKGHDAIDAQGRRVQIKGVRLPNRQLGALRELDENPFDRLVIVVLANDMQSHIMIEMSCDEALERATYRPRYKSWHITLKRPEVG